MRKRIGPYVFAALVIVFLGVCCSFALATPDKVPATSSVASTVQLAERVPGILAAVNDYRLSKHLLPLSLNNNLNKSSQAKALDLVTDQYWSHIAPDGTMPWDLMQKAGYDYKTAGENLAKCYDSPDALVKAWIASPAHEAVLVADYHDAGFGLQHNDKNSCDYVVGHFGRR